MIYNFSKELKNFRTKYDNRKKVGIWGFFFASFVVFPVSYLVCHSHSCPSESGLPVYKYHRETLKFLLNESENFISGCVYP